MSRVGVRWPIAKTPDGAYIGIEAANKGEPYQCPECMGRFVARKASSVRWHFAHYPGAVCSGEGPRHAVAKHLIAAILVEPQQVPLRCFCNLATKPYTVEASDIRLENDVVGYRCDVTCRINGELACIEVIDSHPVPADKELFLGRLLVEVDISQLADDELTRDKLRETLRKQLGHFLTSLAPKHVFVHVWHRHCWSCGRDLEVAIVCDNCREEGDGIGCWSQSLPPGVQSELEKRTTIEFRRTGPVREGYMANVCTSCRAVQGDWHLTGELLELRANRREENIETIFVPLEDP